MTGATGTGSARRFPAARLDGDVVREGVARVASTAAASWSSAVTGDQPSLAAAMASTPEPQPTSTRPPPPGGTEEQELETETGRRMTAVPNACPGSMTTSGSAPSAGACHGARTSRRWSTSTGRWKARQALGPVVADLAGAHLDERRARGRRARRAARELAGAP